MSKKVLYLALSGLLGALLLPVTVVGTQPKLGGHLIIAMPGDDEPAVPDAQMDPYNTAWLVSSFFADNLAFRDYDGKVKPHLAKSWEVSEDGLVWTLHIREGVHFHDGTPLNAEAVKANFDRCLNPEHPTPLTTTKLGPISSVEVVDEYTLKIYYEQPWASFLSTLALGCFPIWSPTALSKYGDEHFSEHLVGSGPFILEEWVPGSHITGVRNPDYNWAPPCTGHQGPVYLDKITIRWISEPAVLGMSLKVGEADLTRDLPTEYVDMYAADPNFTVFPVAAPGTGMASVFNIEDPILKDIRVRRAILHTIDQQAINEIAYGGKLMPSDGVINPATPGYNPLATTTVMYPHNLERAKSLLEEAGWVLNPDTGIREKDGVPLRLEWACLHHPEMGEVAREQLKEVGIDLTVNLVPGPIQLDMVRNRNFQIMYERMRGADIEYLHMLYHSSNYVGDVPGGWNWTGYKDEALDRLLELTQTTFDQDKRLELFKAAQIIIMKEALVLPMLVQTMYVCHANYVKNFRMHSDGLLFDVYDVWLEK